MRKKRNGVDEQKVGRLSRIPGYCIRFIVFAVFVAELDLLIIKYVLRNKVK